MSKTNRIHSEYSHKVQQARQQQTPDKARLRLDEALLSLSAGDKAVVETFEQLSSLCGGDAKLYNLFSIYLNIKNKS